MEAPLSELLSLHWWKVILIILAMPVAAIGFRIAIKFDVNIWQKNRQENKQRAEMMKIVENCGHSWNLYPDSIYSECATCLALIQTTILLLGMKLGDPPPHYRANTLCAFDTWRGQIDSNKLQGYEGVTTIHGSGAGGP